jgi:hypothetical protein
MPTFNVRAYYQDPQEQHQPEALEDLTIDTADRTEAREHAKNCHRFGYWVEVFADGELIAGPLDPDQPAPAYIL